MKIVHLLLFFVFLSSAASAQYNDPNYPRPQTGYGSNGTHPVGIVSFPNPNFSGKNIEIFYPSDVSTSVPTLFFGHGFGGNNSTIYNDLFQFVASKGYAIVFVPYQTIGATIEERYNNLLQGFQKAARDYPAIIDTSRVGFIGHSFGAGALFSNAYSCFKKNQWGLNGRFLCPLAQWYSYGIEQQDLENFPANTKLLVQVYEDDTMNDHRMAMDIFNTISIPDSDKDFIIVKSDTVNGQIYPADHKVPCTYEVYDALDYYAVNRLLDALCDYTFYGNSDGKDVALGNGSVAQTTMPAGLKSLEETDSPQVKYPESKYTFPFTNNQNPRKDYFPAPTSIQELNNSEQMLKVVDHSADRNLILSLPETSTVNEVIIYNSRGQRMSFMQDLSNKVLIVKCSSFKAGIYIVVYGTYRTKFLLR